MQNGVKRFHLLDLSRTIAAFLVVFSHYSHFYYYPLTDFGPITGQPGYDILYPIYDYGGYAVQYFFALSGFVFFHLYAKSLYLGELGIWNFFVLRFSRLYPLHFATLMIVAFLQMITLFCYGGYFIYAENDRFHFVLNVLFIQNWGLQTDFSFNGPSWSVSLELLAYLSFFLFASRIKASLLSVLIVAAVGFILMQKVNFPIGMIISVFFAGGAASVAYRLIVTANRSSTEIGIIATASVVIAVLAWRAIEPLNLMYLRNNIVWGISMPLFVLSLALFQVCAPSFGEKWAHWGDITYASYLIHFPIQLLIAPAIILLGMTPSSWFVLTAYLAVVVVTSSIVYKWFEMPVQNLIRRHTLKKP